MATLKHASSSQIFSAVRATNQPYFSSILNNNSAAAAHKNLNHYDVLNSDIATKHGRSGRSSSGNPPNPYQPGCSLSKPIDESSHIPKNQLGKQDNSSRDDLAVAGSKWQNSDTRCFLLWIDGVGVWQLLMGDRFVIGGPSTSGPEADLAIQANVRKQHAAILSEPDEWLLDPLADTFVANKPVTQKAHLQSGDQIRLGESVELGFRRPSPLSHSAVLDFESGHRPLQSVDGVILLTDHCIVGPRRDQHIYCATWQHSFVLFRRDSKLLCRSSGDFQFNGSDVNDVCEVAENSMIESEHCRFRIEVIR